MRKPAVMLAALLMALGGVATAPGQAAGVDVSQWQYNPATGHWYAQTEPMTWVEAEVYAHTVGGNLVTINDQAEQDWLATTFTDGKLLIGYTDQSGEELWYWSSGEPATYTDWVPGEPNNCGGDGTECLDEDIAVMNWVDPDGVVGWNDLSTDAWLSAIVEVSRDPTHRANGAATQYRMSYGPNMVCTGVRIANKVSVKDNETCLMSGDTDGFIAGTYRGNPTGTLPPWGDDVTWKSDFDGRVATSWRITFVDNGNETFTANILAYY